MLPHATADSCGLLQAAASWCSSCLAGGASGIAAIADTAGTSAIAAVAVASAAVAGIAVAVGILEMHSARYLNASQMHAQTL